MFDCLKSSDAILGSRRMPAVHLGTSHCVTAGNSDDVVEDNYHIFPRNVVDSH